MAARAVILGPQCAGKTTLKKILGASLPQRLVEEDELFTELNGGAYPTDLQRKERELRPRLDAAIRELGEAVYFTSYCDEPLLRELKDRGFKLIQLDLSRQEFERRNGRRVAEEGYADAREWADSIFGAHEKIRESGLVDLVVDADQPAEAVASEITDFLKRHG
jgi:thymidylate kinase